MFTTSRIVVLLLINLTVASSLGQSDPNLIFILTDDQGIESIDGPHWPNQMGCFTPNLASFASQGVSFTNCRVNPNCSPTRAALFTGRSALDTGVHGVIGRHAGSDSCVGTPLSGPPAEVTDRLSLQTQERTIAEVLQDMGYYTVLADKWHIGYDMASDRNLLPTDQGFDVFNDWWQGSCDMCDDSYYADAHMKCMAIWARNAVNNRPDPTKPYALFFHTTTPHSRHADDEGLNWWDILDQTLIPESVAHGYHLNPDNTKRFILNVEAMDSVLVDDLLGPAPGLEVVTANGTYVADSDTIVFFTADNGTDKRVSSHGLSRAKNSMYEGGIHVPLFVFGESVPGSIVNPLVDDRQISHVDFYDTICDIVRAPDSVRNNPTTATETLYPRRSMSFADAINWADPNQPPPVERTVTLSSFGNVNGVGDQVWRVAMIEGRYKLICNGGGPGADDMLEDEFYDLDADVPDDPEFYDLLDGVMNTDQLTAYYSMRDRIVDEWPSAVSVAQPPIVPEYTVDHFSANGRYVLVAHLFWDQIVQDYVYDDDFDEFYDLLEDPDRTCDMLENCGSWTLDEQQLYQDLHDEMIVLVNNGQASPDVRVIDLTLDSSLVRANPGDVTAIPLTIGHQDVGDVYGELHEYRALLKFDLAGSLPPGFITDDIKNAQIIIGLKHDSQAFRSQ